MALGVVGVLGGGGILGGGGERPVVVVGVVLVIHLGRGLTQQEGWRGGYIGLEEHSICPRPCAVWA